VLVFGGCLLESVSGYEKAIDHIFGAVVAKVGHGVWEVGLLPSRKWEQGGSHRLAIMGWSIHRLELLLL
jgi:hypothetical protein